NLSGVIANWCELGENLPPHRRLYENKLERERENRGGGREENRGKMEKEEKMGDGSLPKEPKGDVSSQIA
ncbi:hypothetical protein KUCAC02_011283, partial [Chaenocephalus aceratus]